MNVVNGGLGRGGGRTGSGGSRPALLVPETSWAGRFLPNHRQVTVGQDGCRRGGSNTLPSMPGVEVRRRPPPAAGALELLRRAKNEVVAPRPRDELDADREALRRGATAHRGRGPAGEAVRRGVARGVGLAGAVHVPVDAGGAWEDRAEDQVVACEPGQHLAA